MKYDELETERLKLRMWRESDIDAYAEMCGDPLVMRYLGPGKVLTRNEAWRSIAFFIGHWHLRGYSHWAVEEKATGAMIGRIGFLNPEGWPGFEIGWTLARRAWGKGYATEGAKAALQYAFETLDQRHVISLIHPGNTPSMRVADRIGERFERKTRLFDWDVLVYGIDRPD
jgi:RimJ/RimL family protein N-acetyltransferase